MQHLEVLLKCLKLAHLSKIFLKVFNIYLILNIFQKVKIVTLRWNILQYSTTMLRQYFNCNEILEIFLICFYNILCCVGWNTLTEIFRIFFLNDRKLFCFQQYLKVIWKYWNQILWQRNIWNIIAIMFKYLMFLGGKKIFLICFYDFCFIDFSWILCYSSDCRI